jgi:DNA invertase Pin-like site-specific DNA recombinase
MVNAHEKVTANHLKRNAYLYIRQSTLKQVIENTESAKRQYDLKNRAIALGWSMDQIIVVDRDTGQSGKEVGDRKGFQELVAAVGMDKAGIVMGLEVSRLARNSADWHRLIEICAVTDTLILDEDGIYNTNDFNDRLLLGLKGAMSEAELHILKARLRGGVLNKARRGELKLPLPVGLKYEGERVVLEPHSQIQNSINFFFKTFESTGSAYLTVRVFREKALKFPKCLRTGPHKGDLIWVEMTHSKALNILHNPRYAGVFSYGRTHQTKGPDGHRSVKKLPKNQWCVFLPDSHPGYITLEQFEANERQLSKNSQAYGMQRKTPPREGPALLQGLVVCGICGTRMTVRYHERKGGLFPDYICQSKSIHLARKICQVISGAPIDKAIGELLVKMMIPHTLEVSLAVQRELESHAQEADMLRKKSVEQAKYEVDLARRRYMCVDPENRLVADTLEAEWNEKLRLLKNAEEEYERQSKMDRMIIDEERKAQIMSLAIDFPRLWNHPNTSDRDKKRMVQFLIEDVTLIKHSKIIVNIRFKGGSTKVIELPIPLHYGILRKTNEKVVKEVDQLLNYYKDSTIASILNKRGYLSGDGLPFNTQSIMRIRNVYKLTSHRTRLREKGLLTRREMLQLLGIGNDTLQKLKDRKIISAKKYGDCRSNILYNRPSEKVITIIRQIKQSGRKAILKPLLQNEKSQEVQYEV